MSKKHEKRSMKRKIYDTKYLAENIWRLLAHLVSRFACDDRLMRVQILPLTINQMLITKGGKARVWQLLAIRLKIRDSYFQIQSCK